jgi:hypothetical protein
MTLMRRAPREVYRVFSEEEFFERAAADEPQAQAAAGAEHRLRVLGAGTLLAVVGTVGGLVAIAALTPAMRSGRRTGGLLTATGSFAASRVHATRLWREPFARPRSRKRSSRPTARALTGVARGAAQTRETVGVPAGPVASPPPRRGSEFGFER